MANIEYLGKLKAIPLTSLEEDFKRERAKFQKDELDRALSDSPKKVKPTIEDLLKSNQLLKGSVVLERKKALDEAIEFESRNRRTKVIVNKTRK